VTRDIFAPLLDFEPLFKNKEVMRPAYTPEILPHREREINALASVLVSALRGQTPSNILIYGKTGTGKTAVAKYVGKELQRKGEELRKKVHFIYINCEVVDTQYRVLQNIANSFIRDWSERVPFTGWPTDEVYAKLKAEMDKEDSVTIIILDEVDKLSGDEVLYNLSSMNTELQKARVSLIGISNDLKFTEFLDPRVKSRLGEEAMVFPPYDAVQLQDIMRQRAAMAFKEHGDARRALDLIRVAAELAERERSKRVGERHVRQAQAKIEVDRVTEVVRTLPTQSKLVLLSTILGEESNKDIGATGLTTGEVFEIYAELCRKIGLDILTQRRITDLISELDMLGIITARVISKGRYGRTREIALSVPGGSTKEVLSEDDLLHEVVMWKPPRRQQAKLV
jgi:archaeal cell division control protein 6